MPEEAYYWNYSYHMDIGYLDHPPMVAWLIGLGTYLAGKTEIGVRLPAYLCWVIAAWFMFRLTCNLMDRTSAYRSVMLMAVLPIYFSIGLIMTPDAPLYAAWAGALYFLERALLAGRARAWLGFGVCAGLGLLSKYTIGLLLPAVAAFVLVDRRSRRWLLRPEPYAAILIAAVLFSPVILWNARHGWASFNFQGTRRWVHESGFALHVLLGSAIVLLTPFGLIGVLKAPLPVRWGGLELSGQAGQNVRKKLFAWIFMLVPLSVFVVFSLSRFPKLNWTGPVWLAGLPLLAADMAARPGQLAGALTRAGRRLWVPMIVSCLLFFAGGLYATLIAAPGLTPLQDMDLPVAWEEIGDHVERIEQRIAAATGQEPILMGMDKYQISSQLAFYDGSKGDGPEETTGRHLFGWDSLMWAFWRPSRQAVGRDVLMVDFETDGMSSRALAKHFDSLGKLVAEPITKDGRVVAYLYWRVGYGYRG